MNPSSGSNWPIRVTTELFLGFQALYMTWMPRTDVYYLITKNEVHKQFRASVRWIAVIWHHTQRWIWIRTSADRYSAWIRQKTTLFSGHYLRNRSTLDIDVLGYIGYFNIRNTLPKSGTFLLGHPVYVCQCFFFPILIQRPCNLKFSCTAMFPRTTASPGGAVRQCAYCTGGTVNPSCENDWGEREEFLDRL